MMGKDSPAKSFRDPGKSGNGGASPHRARSVPRGWPRLGPEQAFHPLAEGVADQEVALGVAEPMMAVAGVR